MDYQQAEKQLHKVDLEINAVHKTLDSIISAALCVCGNKLGTLARLSKVPAPSVATWVNGDIIQKRKLVAAIIDNKVILSAN